WDNLTALCLVVGSGLYGFFIMFQVKGLTLIWAFLCALGSAFGVTAGVHRYWSHRSYKATLPLRIFLAFLHTLALQVNCTVAYVVSFRPTYTKYNQYLLSQNSAVRWATNHRVHHKYSETDADPHNAARGFFFSHIGWLITKEHPLVDEKRKEINISDLLEDKVAAFQHRYVYVPGKTRVSFVPAVPVVFWGEALSSSYFICMARYCLLLNLISTVNSVAHIWGNRPYSKDIGPTDSKITTAVVIGEGYHNYHHTFPHDYRSSEFGMPFNTTAMFIEFMAKLGLAYDLRTMSDQVLADRKRK
uniref:Fatty acid desaturase domain-containing protein n=1 Tax=Ciona savignyi TaxID=51511 RepID=H2YFE1_CIOSA